MKKIEQHIDEQWSLAYDEGYQDGWGSAVDSTDTFDDGVKAERDRIVNMLKMVSEQEMETGSPTKAKYYRNAIDLIRIADMDFTDVEDDTLYGSY